MIGLAQIFSVTEGGPLGKTNKDQRHYAAHGDDSREDQFGNGGRLIDQYSGPMRLQNFALKGPRKISSLEILRDAKRKYDGWMIALRS
ncbi:MAG: hypothetical protein H6967_08015 [Chromatiaceae bacterium]|nr:hypothetical protein [Chromatiaceae bacterium]